MVAKKSTPRRRVRKSAPAKVFGPWFRCPRCGSRSIIFMKREVRYSCRRCGCEFLVDWDQQRSYLPESEGEQV